ncbi:hypothetical protein ACFO3D_01405 [Virgibacillus kekensis]|uniref:Uncharacterized protein n=1 Tax=Virgibacillus kekensis TaxID=202261 RepID=A0ABV9DDL9_9BACI
MNLPVYEYHIEKIHVEKVKGILQLGQLVEEEENTEKGIHKIFINDVLIREIEGSGIVGVGITEKDVHKKKQQKKIPPDEAGKEIKIKYEAIQRELALHDVPVFFQMLAVEEKVLETLWEIIQGNEPFQTAVNNIAADVQATVRKFWTVIANTIPKNQLIQHPYICEHTRKEFEDLVVTLGVVVMLISIFLPGYLDKPDNPKPSIGELNMLENPEPDQIIKKLQKGYNLDFLPGPVESLTEHSTTLTLLYNEIIVPLNNQDKDTSFFKAVRGVFDNTNTVNNMVPNLSLTVSQQAYLFTTLIESLTDIPKKVYIIKLIEDLCS